MSNRVKKLVLDAWKSKCDKESLERLRKKGLLTKLLNSNSKRSEKLVEILKESDRVNPGQEAVSDAEFLRKFREAAKGGPKHSIAKSRAHHLTNFLGEYLINAFQSGYFTPPDVDDKNGHKFVFEISNVELPTDLSRLKIYWLTSEDEEVNSLVEVGLEKCLKNQIRSTLTNERVMSYVPQIEFVRDNTQATLNKLDEYLAQVKDETFRAEPEKEVDQNEGFKKREEKSVDNLFGVDFTRLSEAIRKNSEYSEWRPVNEKLALVEEVGEREEKSELVQLKPEAERNKFEVNLKAFQINQRLRKQRENKSTLHKLASSEFYQALSQQKL